VEIVAHHHTLRKSTGCCPEGPEGLEDTEVDSSLLRGADIPVDPHGPKVLGRRQPLVSVGGSCHQWSQLYPEGQLG
jgi:hypothetical protein